MWQSTSLKNVSKVEGAAEVYLIWGEGIAEELEIPTNFPPGRGNERNT